MMLMGGERERNRNTLKGERNTIEAGKKNLKMIE